MFGSFSRFGRGGAMTAIARVALPPAEPELPTEITVLATRTFGAGHGQTTSTATSTGTASTTSMTQVNESGAPLTTASFGYIGWALQANGIGVPGNDQPITSAVIEYPSGTVVGVMTKGGASSFTVPNDTDLMLTDGVVLTTPIPAGASFVIRTTVTVPNGQKRLHQGGFVGVMTTAMSDTLMPVRLFAIGDSIMTQDARGAVLLAASGRCPVLQISIGGTRASSYVGAANERMAKLAKDVGCTHSISNFGTNDFGAGQSEAQMASSLSALRAAYEGQGLQHWQATILPQSIMPTVTALSAVVDSAAEPSLTITVSEADATRFEEAMALNVSGDTGTPTLNGNYWFTRVGPTSWTAPVPADRVDRVGTGDIAIKPPFNFSSTKWQEPRDYDWHSRPSLSTSPRANINARIRAGEFGGAVEWADAVESGRNTGKWRTREDQPDTYHLDNVTLQVIGGIANANRFSFAPNQSNNRAQGGGVFILTGAQRGQYRSSSGSASNNVSLSSNLPAVPAVGDQFVMVSGSASPTSDGVHPSLSGGGTGGAQNRLVAINLAWIDDLLAAA